MHYRAQVNATGRPSLPVMISEAGWQGHDEAEKASSVVAALQEEWLPDKAVEAVIPFLLSGYNASVFAQAGWRWLLWPTTTSSGGATPQPTLQYNATKALRCRLGVGGAC